MISTLYELWSSTCGTDKTLLDSNSCCTFSVQNSLVSPRFQYSHKTIFARRLAELNNDFNGRCMPLPHATRPTNNSTKTSPCSTDSPRQLYILLHDGDALRMDRAQIRVLEEMYQERFGRFLQCLYGL